MVQRKYKLFFMLKNVCVYVHVLDIWACINVCMHICICVCIFGYSCELIENRWIDDQYIYIDREEHI